MGLFAAEDAPAHLLHFQPVILGGENSFFFRLSHQGELIGKGTLLVEFGF